MSAHQEEGRRAPPPEERKGVRLRPSLTADSQLQAFCLSAAKPLPSVYERKPGVHGAHGFDETSCSEAARFSAYGFQ